jgi:hypothetical protein
LLAGATAFALLVSVSQHPHRRTEESGGAGAERALSARLT